MNSRDCVNLSERIRGIQDQRSKIQDRVLELKGVKSVTVVNSVNSVNPVDLPEKLLKAREVHRAMKELRGKVNELVDEYLLVFNGKSVEGKEIVIDLRQERSESEAFIREHNLASLADALPKQIHLSRETRVRIKEAIRLGFNRVMFMPGAAEQEKVPITTFKKELSDMPLAGLSSEDQYIESFLKDPLATECTMVEHEKIPRRGAYLLFYSSGSVPERTKNLTYGDAEKLFKKEGLNGITLQELYLLERKECRKNKNHSWAKYDIDAKKSNWSWCLASRAPGGCVGADWSAAYRQVYVRWYSSVNSFGDLGARPVVVVPL